MKSKVLEWILWIVYTMFAVLGLHVFFVLMVRPENTRYLLDFSSPKREINGVFSESGDSINSKTDSLVMAK
jgi:hypothetical protein